MRKYLIFLLLPVLLFTHDVEEIHQFAGKHFLASYLECDPNAICDTQRLREAMDLAVKASGATILNQSTYIFEPSGITIVYTLSESHASIHTYPEFGACFVDLFTCGDNCKSEPFNQQLQGYLKPQIVNARQFLRHESIEEDPTFENK